MRRFLAMGLALVCILTLGVDLAAAQNYPTKPVRLIIPFPPGGSNDIVGRLISVKLTERLGKGVCRRPGIAGHVDKKRDAVG